MSAVQTSPNGRIMPVPPGSFRLRAAQFWIQALVGLSNRFPRLLQHLQSVGVWFAWNCSPSLREATMANAARILGASSRAQARRRLAREMIGSFYQFLLDMGRHSNRSAADLLAEVESIEGEDSYLHARAAGKGAILVTAHIGSFEVGAAVLTSREPKVRIVFQRDPMPVFERLRSEQHRRTGLIEAPVNPASGDDAWTVWLALRDALAHDEVVLMQGDRIMPGQRGTRLPFLDGHIVLPPGAVKLALATGAPIIPVCAPRTADGRVRIIMERPIWVESSQNNTAGPHPAELELAKVLEGWVSRFASQWMMVQRVWCEDGATGARTTP